MPKVQPSRRVRAQNSTSQRRARAARVEQESLEIDFYYKRYEEKNLQYFIKITTSYYISYISISIDYSLFISKEEWEKMQRKRREKELEVARLEARLAQSKVDLLEVKNREHSFARRDLALLDLQERAKEGVKGSSTLGADLLIKLLLPKLLANLSQLQANIFNSSFNYFFFFINIVPILLRTPSSTTILVTYNLLGFL